MPNEPSLSEIENVNVDAERGSGTPATVIDTSNVVNQLNENARFKAENDWRKYNFFVNNLKDVYKNLQDTNSLEVATQDKDYLKNESAKLFQDISKNPQSIFSPDLQGKLSKLRSDATESKMNRVYDFAHRQYLEQNPELNTDENQKKIEGFWGKKLGERSPYLLNMPTIFDAEAYKGGILNSVLQETQDEQPTKDNQFIESIKTATYSKPLFLQRWDAGLNTQRDKYGHSIKGAVQQMFNELSPQEKAYYNANGGIEKFWHDAGEKAFGSPTNIVKILDRTVKPNSNYLEKEKLDEKYWMDRQRIAIDWGELGLKKQALADKNTEDLSNAGSVLNEAASILNKGMEKLLVGGVYGKGEKQLQIADPTLLQTFGDIDKDGRVSHVPDAVTYNKSKGQLSLIYFGKDENGNVIKASNGGDYIKETKQLDERTWLKTIAKRSFPNKDIGKVNAIVDDALNRNGNSLFNIAKKLKGGQPENKTYNYNGKEYTQEQLTKAAEASGMTLDEYTKQLGIK